MNSMTAAALQDLLATDADTVLVDVREAAEHATFHIGGLLIPLGELMRRRDEIPGNKTVVVYCEKGIRSVIAIQRLEELGYTHLYNLTGGMRAWREATTHNSPRPGDTPIGD
jgi:adenylyltransferase/sulfurtransferase